MDERALLPDCERSWWRRPSKDDEALARHFEHRQRLRARQLESSPITSQLGIETEDSFFFYRKAFVVELNQRQLLAERTRNQFPLSLDQNDRVARAPPNGSSSSRAPVRRSSRFSLHASLDTSTARTLLARIANGRASNRCNVLSSISDCLSPDR